MTTIVNNTTNSVGLTAGAAYVGVPPGQVLVLDSTNAWEVWQLGSSLGTHAGNVLTVEAGSVYPATFPPVNVAGYLAQGAMLGAACGSVLALFLFVRRAFTLGDRQSAD